jgi:hypothetical protein
MFCRESECGRTSSRNKTRDNRSAYSNLRSEQKEYGGN